MSDNFFCFELQSGVYVFGWIGIILSLLTLILTFVGFAQRNYIINDLHLTKSVTEFMLIITICLSFNAMLSNILLISGTCRKNHLELLAWLGIYLIFIIFGGIILLVILCIGIIENSMWKIGISCIGIIITGFYIYIWKRVHHLADNFKILAEKDDEEELIGDEVNE